MDLQRCFFGHVVYPVAAWYLAGDIKPEIRRLRESERWPQERIRSDQLERLRRLVLHAAESVPFYQRSLIHSEKRIESLEDLERFPVVTKAQIQANPNQFRSTRALGRLVAKTTGGSTGTPVTIWKNRRAMLRELAATWRGFAWAGVGPGDKQARFWGVPFTPQEKRRARLTDWVCSRRRCSAFNFSASDLAAYERELVAFHPRYFYGYLSMLVEFANYFREYGRPSPYDLRSIIVTSEVLTAPQRRLLEDVFRTHVFDEYGCGELGTVAHECEHGQRHINDENLIVEVFDGDKPCYDNQVGELVITELNNLAMPLIRYRTGDYGSKSYRECKCGRTLSVLEAVHGRAYDFVVNRDGRLFHGEFVMYIFEEAMRSGLGIRQFQVLQEEVGLFRVRLVAGSSFQESAKTLIARRFRENIDPQARIDFEMVESIPRERSGKIRLIVGLPAAIDRPRQV